MMIKSLIKKIIPSFLIDWYHFSLSFLGALWYCFPSRRLKVIGVTGTNGKSTTVYLISRVLREAGLKVASLSSIEFQINDRKWPNTSRMTMPGRFTIKKFLRQASDAGCQYAVLEVASEGVKQHRHRFIDFEAAVFTNLTPEHIEAHGGFENYKKAKGEFFRAVKNIHVINREDENADYFLGFPAKKIITYGLGEGEVSNKDIQLNLKLPGDFNVSNALAAIAAGLSQGIPLGVCQKAVEEVVGIPGRMERVASAPFKVIVDYAFTPNALEKVYRSLVADLSPSSKLICVLGAAGGGRDKWKRPVLGKIAGKYCNEAIVTNEDPYDENPWDIIDQVAEGVGGKAKKILDRRVAIGEALKLARPGDTVIITGKGCESSICEAGGRKTPWDDRRVVREELAKNRVS
ncbi:MAG: UDP-N-acetylmuramoyl-L-alanyl-D-glutamate--2,6-diaminopimelate ligase [Candidatus Nealsonbacteria bacterium]|nr:UDP-N-acetylmuramoyl-L-alanyl-D-glutamate--2,6-diaminopimelate ligase [Candidatus Nealsonbacteria bacterium]